MTVIAPIPKMQMITPELVRASINKARRSLEVAASEIVWQIEMEAWRTLGYQSWSAMREAEYGGAAFMVPSKSRPEIVARIRTAGLTQRETAETVGVTEQTIYNDERKDRDPKYLGRSEPDDDVIDAEVIEDEPVNPDLDIINDVRLYLRHLSSSPKIASLTPAGKQHIIDALTNTITELKRN